MSGSKIKFQNYSECFATILITDNLKKKDMEQKIESQRDTALLKGKHQSFLVSCNKNAERDTSPPPNGKSAKSRSVYHFFFYKGKKKTKQIHSFCE